MAFSPVSVAASIAGLSVSGVTILQPSSLKPAIQARDCPVIYPAFDFVAGVTDTVRGLGLAGAALHEYRYTLRYLYAHQPAGSGRYPTENTATILANVTAFANALRAADTTSGSAGALAFYVTVSAIDAPAVVADPSDNQFWGAVIALSVLEKGA